MEVDYSRVPVIGILTEPLRGSLHKEGEEISQINEYVPTAHVKFLEQAGIKVIPVSYKLPLNEMRQLLDNLNGLYIHGDSQKSIVNPQFQEVFAYLMDYVKTKNIVNNIHFPVFLMGNSLNTFLKYRLPTNKILSKDMKDLTF